VTPADLDIVIKANVDSAKQGMASLQNSLAQTAVSATKLDSAFDNTTKKITKNSVTTVQSVQNISNVFRDLPFAINNPAIATSAIDHVISSLTSLSAQSGGVKAGLSALAASLSGPSGVLLAFSAISSVLTLMPGLFSKTSSAVDEATKSNDEYIQSLDKIDKSAVQTSQKEIASLQTLASVAKDNTASYQARSEAVIKLQESYPGYFGNLSKETILYGDITDAINKSSDALINKSLADAASSKVAEAGAKLLDLIEKRKTAQEALTAATAKYNEAIKNPQIGQGIVGFTDAVSKAKTELKDISSLFFQADLDQQTFLSQATKYGSLSGGIKGAGDSFKSVDHVLKDLDQSLIDLNRKSIALNIDVKDEKIKAFKSAIDDLLKTGLPATGDVIQGLVQKVKGLGGSFDDASKKVDRIGDVIRNLAIARNELTNNAFVPNLDKPLKDIGLLQTAIQRLRELKAPEPIIIKLQTQIDDEALTAVGSQLQKQFGDLKNLKLPDIQFPAIKAPIEFVVPNEETQFAILKEQVRSLSEKLQITLPVNFEALNKDELKAILDAIPSDVKIKLGITEDQTGFKTFIKNLQDSQKAIDDLNTSISNIAISTLSDAFANFGQALGKGGNPFAAILHSFGKGLEDLGAALIKFGVIKGIISKALAIPLSNPLGAAIAITAGIALEALGALLASKVTGFAEGGIVMLRCSV
jgi:hypothetical protein